MMESEADREAYERVIQEWEEVWEKQWEEKTRNKLEWRTLFSIIFDKERADLYSNIFEERGIQLREVFERGKVHQDIRRRGETYLRYLTHLTIMLHSQILVPCMFRSVSPRLEDNDALKCGSDNFP